MDLDTQIEKKLTELGEASEKEKQFYGKQIIPGEKTEVKDFYEMAEAFDTTSLLSTELDILLAKKHKYKNWEQAVKELEEKASLLRQKIESWKKREFPSST